MAYQVIARKYRPQRFADVVGQDHVTQTLANAIAQNRIAHAYLFVGPRGTGKTTIARIFAKCLNCSNGPRVDFESDDPRCVEISEGRSLDVLEIDGASNRGIEEVRELRETVKYAPANSKFKIYIIDEVHMLTKEAFNALLKTLEEPPAHVKFMFATTEPDKVLATILSRCQRFDLRRIPVPLIVKHLGYIAGEEHVTVEDAALQAIARGAEGCMRDAESTLDQLISFCGRQIVESDVLSMFGLTARGQIHAMAQAVLDGNTGKILSLLNDLVKNGKDLSRLVADLLAHFRSLLLRKALPDDPQVLEVIEADAAVLADQSQQVSWDGVTRILQSLVDCEGRLRDSVSKRIAIEVGLLQAAEARNAVSIDQLLTRLRQLRETTVSDTAVSPRPLPSVPRTPAVSSSAGPSGDMPVGQALPVPVPAENLAPAAAPLKPSASSPADLSQIWSQLLDTVGATSPFVRGYLTQIEPVSWERQVLTAGFHPELADQIELLNNTRNRNLIATKLKEIGLGEAQIKFVELKELPPASLPSAPAPIVSPAKTAPEPPPSRPPTTKAPEKTKPAPLVAPRAEDFKNDPLINKALEIFKGQIAGVQPQN
ncbi:MAG TPA: DNA polymerase III subunit gamma/tau [Candidatus Paceibacterota bacterium]|nr:DNA polymerase III subunit gamma/tau [Candidatus Paceibacterota bacterium]